MNINSAILKDGIAINVNKEYNVIYPKSIWPGLKLKTKQSIVDNLAYAKLASYSAFLKDEFIFNSALPHLKSFFDECAVKDFPRFAHEDNLSVGEMIQNFKNAKFRFNSNEASMPDEEANTEDGAVLGISFGKDSLLTYAVAKEIKLPIKLVFVKDCGKVELKHKLSIMREFKKKFNEEIFILKDNTDHIASDKAINTINSEGIYGSNAMNGYTLMLLPFAYHFKTNNILFGNEHNLNDYFIDEQGFKCHPSYEQSSECIEGQNNAIMQFTGKKIGVASLINPLYCLSEYKILYKRYPRLAEFQMSCPHDPYENQENKWCYQCSTCARAFLYTNAVGGDIKSISFNKNFFDKEYERLYVLFDSAIRRIYEKPKAVRDEQLFAFYLASRNGNKSYLVEKFKKEFLDEAKEREDELYNKFFGVHPSPAIPTKFKSEITSIYKEELSR
ncbi:MAG: hypothetical protein Q7J54_06365 [Candidatus Woesearchaeota archaeon]|nr:hypothetical protein [Candidatus Woesearchaeota archaeon]